MPEPVTVPALAALLTRRAAGDIIALLEATPDDKLAWTPESAARSLLEQVKECALVNTIWTVIIRERGLPDAMPPEFYAFVGEACDTRERGIAMLQTTTAALATAIEGVEHEETGAFVRADEISGQMLPLSECCLYPYWHLVYHEGQMNFLQTLYGDREDRHNYRLNGEGEPSFNRSGVK